MPWVSSLSDYFEEGHPLVRELFDLINQDPRTWAQLAKDSGVDRFTIFRWRKRSNPNLLTLEAVLNTLGYNLKIEKHERAEKPVRFKEKENARNQSS